MSYGKPKIEGRIVKAICHQSIYRHGRSVICDWSGLVFAHVAENGHEWECPDCEQTSPWSEM